MQQKGFTIVELIITIFVLSIAIIGVYNAFSILVILTSNITNRLTAAYLAQEGMEIIRNIRDSNWIVLSPWDDGLSNCASPSGCDVDYMTNSVDGPLPYVADRNLYINSAGFYNHSNDGQKTRFKRKIIITPVDGYDYIMKVVVNVSWDERENILNSIFGGQTQPGKIEATEYLYNWF